MREPDDHADDLIITTGGTLRGTVTIPGDKSISHRAVLLGALGNGFTQVRGWLAAGDTEASLRAVQALGVTVHRPDPHTLAINGGSLQAPEAPLDLANAGTGLRLLAGILAGQPFSSVLDGSEQLRRRPMKRIITPLQMMQAKIGGNNGRAPLTISPSTLHGIQYTMPVASAQVKSAILLAGLYAKTTTAIIQPGPARDHTERMLQAMGADLAIEGNRVILTPNGELQPLDLTVPGDFSSAAFLIAAATILPGSDVTIQGVNLNPTRTGLLDVLQKMGADIDVVETGLEAGESVGDIRVCYSRLHATEVSGDTVVRMIDEFPIFMVVALHAQGMTTVTDASELRVKETDRLAVMTAELNKMGARILETPDGFRIAGPQRLHGAVVDGNDDHRIAMSMAIAGLTVEETTTVLDARCAHDSFPGFARILVELRSRVEVD